MTILHVPFQQVEQGKLLVLAFCALEIKPLLVDDLNVAIQKRGKVIGLVTFLAFVGLLHAMFLGPVSSKTDGPSESDLAVPALHSLGAVMTSTKVALE